MIGISMTTKNLIETGNVLSESPNEDGTWRVRLINEGRGSSGYYSAELLENYHSAFDGVISFLNHPSAGPESRNFTEIAGRVVGETWIDTAEDGTKGVYANWMPDPDHKKKLETYRDRLGLSIYISGSGDEDSEGEFHVTEFDREDPFRSVDVVIAAGRGGRFELNESVRKIYESRRGDSDQTTTTAVEERKDNETMDEKAIEAINALTAQVSALVADKENAKASEAQVEADAKAVADRLDAFEAAVKAVDGADLLTPQREALLASAKRGEDVTQAIEDAKAFKEAMISEVRESATEDSGRVLGSAKSKFGAWK